MSIKAFLKDLFINKIYLKVKNKKIRHSTEDLKDLRCYSLTVYGLVQGVSFRWWLAKVALENNVGGWVCNSYEGNSVEAVIQGTEENLQKVIELCHTGSPASKVEKVEYNPTTESKIYKNFTASY